MVEESRALAGISSASIQGRIAFGPRAGARVWRVGDDPDAPWVLSTAPRHAHLAGFDLHANVAVPAAHRRRLEQLCRYLLRPAVAQGRLRRLDDGRIVLTLKAAWADGTLHLVFEPLTLLERLAALTPRPRPPGRRTSRRRRPPSRHWAWANLMRRAFDIDVLACPRCGRRLRLIATVEDSDAIRAILVARAISRERADRAPPFAASLETSLAATISA